MRHVILKSQPVELHKILKFEGFFVVFYKVLKKVFRY